MQATLTLESDGKVVLPELLRKRYGFEQNVPIQVIETASGILLVPLTNEPMSAALQEELAAWQSLSAEAWEQFPYEEVSET
ncbi:MAG: hypothetical protein HOP19_03805 [Acidobacteria bacterium]|nr:hypothetical protein [Acidobacteriota bacterium]